MSLATPFWPGWKVLRLTVLLTFSVWSLLTSSVNATYGEYCQWETFQAKCEAGSVIVMRSASYGRMSLGPCIEKDYGYIGCSSDVLRLADFRCSGRRTCTIKIPDEAFDATSPCPKDLRRYLIANYDCIPVASKKPEECRRSAHATLTDTSGYIGSVVTEESGCGTTETPWKVHAKPGQRINFTLMDFATANNTGGELGRGASHCHVYVILKEAGGRSVTVCGGLEREKQIFTSSSNSVEIRVLTGASSKMRHFLLKYEVWGCPDVPTPRRGWVKHQGAHALIGCDSSEDTWELTCNGSVWQGHMPQCNSEPSQSLVIGNVTVPYTVSLLIIVGVALMIGLCILTVGLLCLRRQRVLRRGRGRGPLSGGTLKSHDKNTDPYQKVNVEPYEPPYMSQQETSENEYAYVDDFFPPPPPPITNTGTGTVKSTKGGGDGHGTTGRGSSGGCRYEHNNGSTSRGGGGGGGRTLPKIPGSCGQAYCSPARPCENCRADHMSSSRHYFELDPENGGGGGHIPSSGNAGGAYTHAHSQQPLLCQPADVMTYPSGYESRRCEQGSV